MTSPPTITRRPTERRGTSYVAVLGLATLVAAMAIGGSLVTASNRAATSLRHDEQTARAAGMASLAWGTQVIASNASWRNAYTHGKYLDPVSLQHATMTYGLMDEDDGSFVDNVFDSVRITGVGRSGLAARAYSVALEPAGSTLEALGLPLYTDENLTVSGTVYATGGSMACGKLLTVNLLATLDGSAECAATLNLLGTVTGGYKTGVQPRLMPHRHVSSAYQSIATPIAFGLIPSGTISGRLLTPTSNPFGLPSSRGVYSISVPIGSTLTITNARLEATLVISLAAGARLVVSGTTLWEPPPGNYPALIVSGVATSTVTLQGSLSPLSESATGVNFNPLSSPHASSSDTDTTDTYPSMIRGVVHIQGAGVSVSFTNDVHIRGACIVESSVSASNGANLVADPMLFTNPPWGYFTPDTMRRVPSTWRREPVP
ncbi:MAG: hypothetical protein HBSAPP03_24670 [Phycisphaerae bacterium]|nr:MAG: hypothetical protein HBSAPP03_24670 [Phycisphaerae bacterium]